MAPDMSSGWGIRTLSSSHPAYNPHSYQNGSVWPHDNGFIYWAFAATVSTRRRRRSRAASATRPANSCRHRVPELYAGLPRDGTSFPVQYKGANVPQAWAAGSCFAMLPAPGLSARCAAQTPLRRSLPAELDARSGADRPSPRRRRARPSALARGRGDALGSDRGPAEMVEQRSFKRGTALWPAAAEGGKKLTA